MSHRVGRFSSDKQINLSTPVLFRQEGKPVYLGVIADIEESGDAFNYQCTLVDVEPSLDPSIHPWGEIPEYELSETKLDIEVGLKAVNFDLVSANKPPRSQPPKGGRKRPSDNREKRPL